MWISLSVIMCVWYPKRWHEKGYHITVYQHTRGNTHTQMWYPKHMKNGVSRKYVFKHIRMQMQIQRQNRIVFIKIGILLVFNPFYSLIDHTNISQGPDPSYCPCPFRVSRSLLNACVCPSITNRKEIILFLNGNHISRSSFYRLCLGLILAQSCAIVPMFTYMPYYCILQVVIKLS